MKTFSYIILWVVVVLQVLSILLEPLAFGKERAPYTATSWLIKVFLITPILVGLIYTIINY